MRSLLTLAACLASTMLAMPRDATAEDAPLKSVRLLISSGPAAVYDIYGRLVARHLGRFLPGNPAIVAENMTGADGLNAANFLYNNAPKDGSIIATFNSAIALYQALGQRGIRFDAQKFSWIGSVPQATALVGIWHDAGIRSLDDAKTHEIVMGATGAGGTMAGFPALFNRFLGTRFKIVTGYDSASAVDLAIERGEVQGRAMITWPTLSVSKPDWISGHKLVVILQIGPRRDPHLPDVPLLTELARNDSDKRIFGLISSTVSLGQPFAAAPGLSSERLSMLRHAFEQMGRDPGFEADEAKIAGTNEARGVTSGAETARVVASALTTPSELIGQVKSVLQPQ